MHEHKHEHGHWVCESVTLFSSIYCFILYSFYTFICIQRERGRERVCVHGHEICSGQWICHTAIRTYPNIITMDWKCSLLWWGVNMTKTLLTTRICTHGEHQQLDQFCIHFHCFICVNMPNQKWRTHNLTHTYAHTHAYK